MWLPDIEEYIPSEEDYEMELEYMRRKQKAERLSQTDRATSADAHPLKGSGARHDKITGVKI